MSCPVSSIPLSFRVVLWSPSHPTTHRTETCSVAPSRWIVATQAVLAWSSSSTRRDERITLPPCWWRYSVRIDSVTSSEMPMLNP